MTTLSLSFDGLRSTLEASIETLSDPRKPSNGRLYSLSDAMLGAFGAFYMQSNSFLEYQRHLDSREGRNNAQSLFGLTQVPSLEQIRNILDPIAAIGLFKVFDRIYRTNAHISSYFTSGAFTVSQHLQQVLVIPSGFEPFGMSAALG